MWGGVECTVVRVGRETRDQLAETGHGERLSDLDRIAALGVRTVRYPVLWERVAPDNPDSCDWTWSDERLGRLRELGVRPIVGLVHHGAGPRYTSLVDPRFADGVARHAARVAARYPWVEDFTPINEPLTTARFAGLYGHWHPHGRDYPTLLRALVNQCTATLRAMRAIRRVTPHAWLVQTEDLGRVFATPTLRAHADHENERRWLSLDILCGRLDPDHPWWPILLENGIGEDELRPFLDGEAAPDIMGINHYLTSDRFLTAASHRYPEDLRGGDGRRRYADVEAVRMDLPPEQLGVRARLMEAWNRYRRPLAVTEAHHGCTRDEQVRWLLQAWRDAEAAVEDGADIRAVTAWSMFGAVDWNSLLTRRAGFYEPGAFDVRGPEPRPTALATAIRSLATTGAHEHPLLARRGWWAREGRHYRRPRPADARRARPDEAPRPVLVTGGTGTLGQAIARVAAARGLDVVLSTRAEVDIADPASVAAALERIRPWAVVNAAGFVRVADAERERAACFRANATGAAVLARACAESGLPFATISSDLVFSGTLGRAYVESDPVDPTTAYGASKAEAERVVAAAHPDALIVRTSAFFGPWDVHNVVYGTLRALAAGEVPALPPPCVVSPTYVPDLAHATLDLLIDGERGIRHLANRGEMSWTALAERVAREAGLRMPRGAATRAPSTLPSTVLGTERGWIMPPLEDAIARYFRDAEPSWRPAPIRALAAE